MDLQQFKNQYPVYKDIPDVELADKLYNKYYKDTLTKSDFDLKIGLSKQNNEGFFGQQKIIDPEEVRQKEKELTGGFSTDLRDYIPFLDNLSNSFNKATRDIVSGVATLPTDIYSFATGSEKAEEISRKIDKTIPDFKVTPAEDLGANLIKYGVGGYAGAKKALDFTIKKAKNLGKKSKYAIGIAGATVGDIVVTNPDNAFTIGDSFNLPTQIREGDSNFVKRLKVGIETPFVAPIVDTAIKGVTKPVKFIYDRTIRPYTEKGKMETVTDAITPKKYNVDTKKIENDLIKTNEILNKIDYELGQAKKVNVKPTLGTITSDPQIISVEKALANKVDSGIPQRRIENIETLNKELDKLLKNRTSDKSFEQFFKNKAEELRFRTTKLELQKKEAVAEVDNIVDEFSKEFTSSVGDTASISLSKIIRKRLEDTTKKKNQLFDAIDPEYKSFIDINPVKEVVEKVSKPKSRGDSLSTDVLNSLDVIKKIKSLYKPTKKKINNKLVIIPAKPVTFGEIQDFRSSLTDNINKAKKADEGALVSKLDEIKKTLDDYTEIVAQKSDDAGIRAKEALEYYKKEYVPLFRQSIGNEFRKGVRSNTAIPESLVASKFILGRQGGSLEAIESLSKIIKNSGSVIQANKAINDYVAMQLARSVMNQSGNAVPAKIKKFKDNYSSVFKLFPETKAKVESFEKAVKTGNQKVNAYALKVEDAKNKFKQNSIQQNLSNLELVINKSPIEAINSVMTSPDSGKRMAQLVALAKQDKTGNSLEGLKSALKEWTWQKSTTTKNLPASEYFELSRAKVNQMLNTPNTRSALEQLFTKDEIKVLENIQRQLNNFDAINFQVTTGSPTAVINENKNRLRIILASWYGIVKGRGIFAISEFVQKNILGVDPAKTTTKLLSDAMLDPKLARLMLQKYTLQNKNNVNQKIGTYLSNNLIAEIPNTIVELVKE